MEKYVVVPLKGVYRVMVIVAGGSRGHIATYATEREALARLRELEREAELWERVNNRKVPGATKS